MRRNLVPLLACLLGAAEARAACYDLSKGEPHVLTGVLSHRIFPGPPNFEDVRAGDKPERAYVHSSAGGADLSDRRRILADEQSPFSEAQARRNRRHGESDAVACRNAKVAVTLSQPMAAQTGPPPPPFVAWVTRIARVDSGAR